MPAEIVSAVPMPFTQAGDIDWTTYTRLLRHIGPHVHGALIAGTTGEFPALDDDERLRAFAIAAEELGAGQVIAHIGHASLRQVLRLGRAAHEAGLWRLATLTPYYLPTDDAGLIEFFARIVSALPGAEHYAYVFPERTGLEVTPATLEKIVALPGMAGVKLSGSAANRVAEYAAALPEGPKLYSGNDGTLPLVIGHGGTGVVSGVSTAFPRLFADLAAGLDAGRDVTELQAAAEHVVELAGPSISRLKAALAARDGADWTSRMSMPEVDAGTRKTLVAAVRRYR